MCVPAIAPGAGIACEAGLPVRARAWVSIAKGRHSKKKAKRVNTAAVVTRPASVHYRLAAPWAIQRLGSPSRSKARPGRVLYVHTYDGGRMISTDQGCNVVVGVDNALPYTLFRTQSHGGMHTALARGPFSSREYLVQHFSSWRLTFHQMSMTFAIATKSSNIERVRD